MQLELNSSKLQTEEKRKKFERIVIMELFENLWNHIMNIIYYTK